MHRPLALTVLALVAPLAAAAPATDLVVALRWQVTGDEPPADGSRVLRAGPPADEPPALPAQRVRVGERAVWEDLRWQARQQLDWVWTAQGQGLQGGTRWAPLPTRLAVQPRWTGGAAPVDLAWQLERPAPPAADGTPAAQALLQGRASLPLGRWVTLAEAAPAAPESPAAADRTASTRGGAGAARGGWRLQARIERP